MMLTWFPPLAVCTYWNSGPDVFRDDPGIKVLVIYPFIIIVIDMTA